MADTDARRAPGEVVHGRAARPSRWRAARHPLARRGPARRSPGRGAAAAVDPRPGPGRIRSTVDLLAPLPVGLADSTPAGNSIVLAADGSLITFFYRNNRTPVAAEADRRRHEAGPRRHRGLPLLRAPGAGRGGHRCAPSLRNVRGRRRHGGRLDDHPAAGQADPAADGHHARGAGGRDRGERRPQAPRGPAGPGPGASSTPRTRSSPATSTSSTSAGAPTASRPRPSGTSRQRGGPDAAAGGDARRARADAGQRRPDRQPRAAPSCGATRCCSACTPSGTSPHEELAEIPGQPVEVAPRRRRPTAASTPSVGGFFCDFLQRHLTGTLGHHPGAAGDRRPDDPDDAAAGPAGVRRPGGARRPGAGRPAGQHVHGGRAGHRQGPGDERQPAVRLRRERPRPGVGQPQPRWPARAPGRRTRSSSPPRRWSGASRPGTRHHDQRSRTSPGSTRNGRAPYTVQNAGSYPPTLTMVEALVRSSNTYFVALEDQLGSVEGPVRMAQRMGLFSLDPVADQVVAENRGLVHPRRRGDQPARAGQRLLHAGRQRHAVRPDPGRRDPRRARRAAHRPDGAPLPHRRPTARRTPCRRPWRPR